MKSKFTFLGFHTVVNLALGSGKIHKISNSAKEIYQYVFINDYNDLYEATTIRVVAKPIKEGHAQESCTKNVVTC